MSAISSLNSTELNQNAATASSSQAADGDSLANREAFLQMLVAQIQNQDPLNPTDGVEFLSQLAQFSELEQMLGIRGELTSLRELAEAAAKDPAAAESAS